MVQESEKSHPEYALKLLPSPPSRGSVEKGKSSGNAKKNDGVAAIYTITKITTNPIQSPS